MRILQLVTLYSRQGEYGGPTRVALNLAKALRDKGNEVRIVAGSLEREKLTHTLGEIQLTTFPAFRLIRGIGFAGVCSPALLLWLFKSRKQFDVLHVHMGRDMVSLPAALLAKVLKKSLVIQTHGMILKSPRFAAKLLDAIATNPAFRHASKVLALTEEEKEVLARLGCPASKLQIFPNGITVDTGKTKKTKKEPSQNVLFLARLHERKRPVAFVRMASILHNKLSKVTFTIAGPDEGQLQAVKREISNLDAGGYISVIGAVEMSETQRLMQNAAVYVLPAVDEIFPMTLLEAFAAGTPAIVSDSIMISSDIRNRDAAVVTELSPESMAGALIELLRNKPRQDQIRKNAREWLNNELNIEVLADKLVDIYNFALPGTR